MFPNLICCLMLCQLCTHGMLKKIVNPSNNLCIVCFPCIYQSNISFLNNLRCRMSESAWHRLTIFSLLGLLCLVRWSRHLVIDCRLLGPQTVDFRFVFLCFFRSAFLPSPSSDLLHYGLAIMGSIFFSSALGGISWGVAASPS